MVDLETCRQKNNPKSVLLFPPLPSRLRFLIHKTIEDLPEFTSFSVGESWSRRVVVCHSELRVELEEDGDVEGNNCVCEELPNCKEEIKSNIKPKPSIPPRSRGPKRPDQPLYMPRAARERLTQAPTETRDLQSPGRCSSVSVCIPVKSCSCPETTESTKHSASPRQESCAALVDSETSADCSALCTQERKQQGATKLHESVAVAWEQTQSCFADMNIEDDEKEDLTSVPYSVQTEYTETDDITEQIKAHLKEPDAVSVEHVRSDYSIYENVSFNSDDFRHVIEIYNFPAFFKTDDLLNVFAEYSDGGMKIKWVDNTHALGVFSSEVAAAHAVSIHHPVLKARALSEGSKKAQGKAVRRAEFIQPVKERPRTDCAVAKRLVTRALGIREGGRVQRY